MEELIKLFTEYTGTFLAFSTLLAPLVVEAIFEHLYDPEKKLIKSIMSWVVIIIIIFPIWQLQVWLSVGWLAELTIWWHVAIWGAGSAIVANVSWVNIEWIKIIIKKIVG